MLNANMLKKEIENLFKEELNLDIIVDGEAIAEYIETEICENLGIDGKGCEVEDTYYIDNKKYNVIYNVDVEYKEEDERIVPEFTFNSVRLY